MRQSQNNLPCASRFRIIRATDAATRATDQCDCACVDTRVAAHAFDPDAAQPHAVYHLPRDTRLTPLADDWHFAFQPRALFAPVVLNDAARDLLAQFAAPRSAQFANAEATAAARELITTQLLAPTERLAAPTTQVATTLTAWLHLTNACNLRCAYCYLAQSPAAMPRTTGERALDAVVRSAVRRAYRGIKIKFAGGEPLIDPALVWQLHDYARRITARHSLALDAVVLSNGTLLTAPIIEQLRAHNLRLMISLDGVGAAHDAQRHFADGRGSFVQVARGIDLALARGVAPEISVTLSDRNLDDLPATMEFILARDLPFTLNFYRENDCAGARADLRLDDARIIAALREAYRVVEKYLPRRSCLGSLADRASFLAPHARTCAVGCDYLVIDPRGRIAKCQMQMDASVTDVRAADPLQVVQADRAGIQNIEVDEKVRCRDCEWKYFCAGGCPLATFRATGRYDMPSPHCAIYRAIYPQILRLEALRLIKYYAGEIS